MSVPPVPPMCDHRPRLGGLVVPYVSFEHNGTVALGGIDPHKQAIAFEKRLCQVCERPLGERLFVVVRPQDVGAGYAPEPGLHQQCLRYSEKACPMLNGTAETQREGGMSSHPSLRRCDDPACLCSIGTFVHGSPHRPATPALDWDAWMLPLEQYQLRRGADGAAVGIELPSRPLRIRRIRLSPDREKALRMVEALQALGL
ncbi:hypothetical protein CTZ27_31245 [Streptomyces griseocarneus]|nr:hypothetical protein CTZ27_31245 [Streptomyces griseocarneus]